LSTSCQSPARKEEDVGDKAKKHKEAAHETKRSRSYERWVLQDLLEYQLFIGKEEPKRAPMEVLRSTGILVLEGRESKGKRHKGGTWRDGLLLA